MKSNLDELARNISITEFNDYANDEALCVEDAAKHFGVSSAVIRNRARQLGYRNISVPSNEAT